jgi:cyclophilin family peptidyl-prolyl cis-trans isomerase
MATQRKPKRARKKDRRNARRDEWRQYVQRRRRQRWGVFLGSLGVVAIGVVVAFFAFKGGDKTKDNATATSKPVVCGKTRKESTTGKKEYSEPKDQHLDENKTYVWRLETSCGTFDVELALKESPNTVNSVVFLTREGFYDGTLFHRITKNSVIQGGDPKGTGEGGPGYQVKDPVPSDLEYTRGTVAMAKTGADPPGTSGSQFFVAVPGPGVASFPPDYALLGRVVKGMDVIAKIEAQGNIQDMLPPQRWVYIERATIVEK